MKCIASKISPIATALTVPDTLTTERTILRRWRPSDAVQLGPVLEANWDHLGPWIPIHVAEPIPKAELETRLAGFVADFDADLKWRYGMYSASENDLLGEVDMFPRDANGRVAYSECDRVEIGYWVRSDLTGRGLVTEGVRRMLDLAASLPRVERAEIRCDARNAPSAAIPARLGFVLERSIREHSPAFKEPNAELQVWSLDISSYRSMKDHDDSARRD
jgi:RimJ/RimL family protein N-acetyltransferase